jgi:hypothetical protein
MTDQSFWETPSGMVCQLLRDLAIRQESFVDNKILDTAVEAYDLARLIYLRYLQKAVAQ